jgi:hypothetical protein
VSKWRRLAIEMFPEYRNEFQHPEISYYGVLFSLRTLVKEYHQADDMAGLRKVYGYVEWCWWQWKRARDVGNAAAVAFYEHLVDDPITLQAIPYWVKPYIFKDMIGLFEWMFQGKPGEIEALVKQYNKVNGTNFQPPQPAISPTRKPKSKSTKRKSRDGRSLRPRTKRT